MTSLSRSAVAAVFFLAAAGAGFGAEIRIAVVDMGRTMDAYEGTKVAEASLQKRIDEFEATQEDMLKEREKLKKEFETAQKEASDKALSEQAREEKISVAEGKLTAVREYERKIREATAQKQKEFATEKSSMRKEIVAKLRDTIKAYAEKEKLTVVLDSSAPALSEIGAVVYSQEKLDITDEIIKLLPKKKE